MTLYTAMPLELVLDGIQNEPGPFVEVTIQGVTMQLQPVAPGIGRIVRLLAAPLSCYLLPEYLPGRTICFHPTSELPLMPERSDFTM
ncbi:YlzJ-like family protein [Cohnella silvisoli]|uniref:YlzJ-like family protein n=1 Tax=Cohnella silvisoli TaxID=2873699 RepID=A0ABV1KVM6_9BACL|nr:YlzJ-like family protein [Cohnella silvisoli]MCD9023423.1 YlzJ-like family protein [Cohnella silvisoli]